MINIFFNQRVFPLFFTAIFLWSSGVSSAPGFLADTLVDTPSGYIPIQKLKVGDSVYSRNPETGDLTRTKIARIKTRMIEHFARITITPKGSLLTAEDQEFYNGDASDKAKISELVLHEARYLRKDDQIATISRFEKVSKLEITNWWLCQAYVYCIELESHHNFYVSLRWTDAKATKPSYASFLVHDGIKDIGIIESAAQAAFSGTSSIVGPGIISVGVGAGVTAAHAIENVANFAKENPKLTQTVLTIGAICFFGVGLVMLPALANSGGHRGGFSTSGGYTEYDYRLDRVKYELEWREQEEYRLSKRELKKADKRVYRELIELQKQMIQKEKQKHNNNNNNNNSNNNNNDDVIIIEAPRRIQNQKTETLEEKKQETIQVEESHSKDNAKNTEEIVSEILSVLNSETSEMGSIQSVDAMGKIVDAAVVVATAGAVWVADKFKDKRDEIDKQIDEALNHSVEPKAGIGVNRSRSNKDVHQGSYVLPPVTSSNDNSKSESCQTVSTENVSVTLENQSSKFIEIKQDHSKKVDNFVSSESNQAVDEKNDNVFHGNGEKDSKQQATTQKKAEVVTWKGNSEQTYQPSTQQQIYDNIRRSSAASHVNASNFQSAALDYYNYELERVKQQTLKDQYLGNKIDYDNFDGSSGVVEINGKYYPKKNGVVSIKGSFLTAEEAEYYHDSWKEVNAEKERTFGRKKYGVFHTTPKKQKSRREENKKENREREAVIQEYLDEQLKQYNCDVEKLACSINSGAYKKSINNTNAHNQSTNSVVEVTPVDKSTCTENISSEVVPQSEIYEHSDNVIEVKEVPFVQDEESRFSVDNQKTENSFPFQPNQKILEIIQEQRNHKKSLTEKIVDLLPQSFLKANDQGSDFEPFVMKEPREESYKSVIKSSPSKGIETIPVQERDPAENIITTPAVEHDHANDILDNPITQNDPGENIIVTPISEPQSTIICEIPSNAPVITELCYKTEEECGWSMPEGGGYINGRYYSQHALERMAPNTPEVRKILKERQEKSQNPKIKNKLNYVNPRGIPPMVIEDIIQNGKRYAGSEPDRENFTNGEFTVIVGKHSKSVITVKHFEEKDCKHS